MSEKLLFFKNLFIFLFAKHITTNITITYNIALLHRWHYYSTIKLRYWNYINLLTELVLTLLLHHKSHRLLNLFTKKNLLLHLHHKLHKLLPSYKTVTYAYHYSVYII